MTVLKKIIGGKQDSLPSSDRIPMPIVIFLDKIQRFKQVFHTQRTKKTNHYFYFPILAFIFIPIKIIFKA